MGICNSCQDKSRRDVVDEQEQDHTEGSGRARRQEETKELASETTATGEPLLKRSKPAQTLEEDDVDEYKVPVFLRVECAPKDELEDFYELCSFQKNDRPVWFDGQNYIYCTSNLQWAVAMDENGVNGDRGWLYDDLGGAEKKYPTAVRSWKLYNGDTKEWAPCDPAARVSLCPPPHINVECQERSEANGCYTLLDWKADIPMWGSGKKRLYLNEMSKHWAICLDAVSAEQGGGILRSGANDAVETSEGDAVWPNTIYNWDYHDGEGWVRSATRVSMSKRPPPARLVVSCPEKRDVEGTYKLNMDFINGFVHWHNKETDCFIYQTANKTWAVCIGKESTTRDQGWMYAANRESKFPDKVSRWDVYDGSEWQQSPDSSCTIPDKEKKNPPNQPVYKPKIAEEETFGIESAEGNEPAQEEAETETGTSGKGGRGILTKATTKSITEATRMEGNNADLSGATRILPNTAWHEIKPTRGTLKELAESASIRRCCPKIDRVVDDVDNKTQEMMYAKLPVKLEENHLAAIIAYTHDVQNGSRKPDGNIYFELNKALRSRGANARKQTMEDWGTFVHYLIMGLSKLPDWRGECYRGYPNKAEVLEEYEMGRPIQWGAFASVTTSWEAAKAFTDKKNGVIFKIAVTSGRKINQYSFFPDEDEVLLTPSHRFTVISPPFQKDGYTVVSLMQQLKAAFVS